MVVSIGPSAFLPNTQESQVSRVPRSGWSPFFRRRLRWRWGPGRDTTHGAEKRLADLGIVVGSKIKIVKKAPFGGPIEVEVAGSRLLIGRRLAERIIVEA